MPVQSIRESAHLVLGVLRLGDPELPYPHLVTRISHIIWKQSVRCSANLFSEFAILSSLESLVMSHHLDIRPDMMVETASQPWHVSPVLVSE